MLHLSDPLTIFLAAVITFLLWAALCVVYTWGVRRK